MPYCPHCGSRTGDSTDCNSCGTETEGDLLTDGGQGPNDRRGNQPTQPAGNNQPQGGGQGQPPQGGQSRQPQGQQQGYNQQGQQPRGNQRRGPPPQQGNDGFSRRQLLLGGGGAVALLGGGWFFFLRENDGDGPKAVVEEFYAALDDGDIERANSLIHADSPEGELTANSFNQNADFTVESVTIPDEESQYSANEYDSVQEFRPVEIELTVSANGNEQTNTVNGVVAKNANGEWKIWE